MSKVLAIGTANPTYQLPQDDMLSFVQRVYAPSEAERRVLRFMFHQSGINSRYSVIPDYALPIDQWSFYPQTENLHPFPTLEDRMKLYDEYAAPLSADAIRNCLTGVMDPSEITHLITVSCTGMSAPGLDLQVMDLLGLKSNTYRTSVNFMGCYAAVHALKIANGICNLDKKARVMVVCTELCTLHFQLGATKDNINSSVLFGDGSAAALVVADTEENKGGIKMESFYSEVANKGKQEMAWSLSSTGFLMRLSGYVPDLIEQDFAPLAQSALDHLGIKKEDIKKWCIHPGGRKILEAIENSLHLEKSELSESYDVLRDYGNMSSCTILYVLKKMLEEPKTEGKIFGAAFGPGLTMETFIASAA